MSTPLSQKLFVGIDYRGTLTKMDGKYRRALLQAVKAMSPEVHCTIVSFDSPSAIQKDERNIANDYPELAGHYDVNSRILTDFTGQTTSEPLSKQLFQGATPIMIDDSYSAGELKLNAMNFSLTNGYPLPGLRPVVYQGQMVEQLIAEVRLAAGLPTL